MARASILIVDDEPNIVRTVKNALRVEGYDTDSASTGPEALEKLASRGHDLALLDVQLPQLDGLEVLRRAREAPVKAPASWPKSSLSISSAGTAAQLSFSSGPCARFEPSWIARATSSLPVPRSPVTSTGAFALAARRTRSRS